LDAIPPWGDFNGNAHRGCASEGIRVGLATNIPNGHFRLLKHFYGACLFRPAPPHSTTKRQQQPSQRPCQPTDIDLRDACETPCCGVAVAYTNDTCIEHGAYGKRVSATITPDGCTPIWGYALTGLGLTE
jgi:hypothetical protein